MADHKKRPQKASGPKPRGNRDERGGQKRDRKKPEKHGATKQRAPQKPVARQEEERTRPSRKPNNQRPFHKGDVIYGLHAVRAALANPQRKHEALYLSDNAAIRLGLGERLPSFAKLMSPSELDNMVGEDAVHQGAILFTSHLPSIAIEDLMGARLLLILDQVTDPHNLGAIARSAAALGAGGIIMTERNSPPLDGVAAKAASGGMEHVPIALVPNLASAITELQQGGYLCVGLDSEGEADLAAMTLSAPMALVLGAEGKGLRRLTRERCDALARIDMPGPIKSLNVSNAALLSLYIARTKIAP